KKIGAIKNVKIANVTITDCKPGEQGWPRTCFISGRPESRLENISLENVKITYRGGGRKAPEALVSLNDNWSQNLGPLPAAGFYIRFVNGLTLKNVDLRFEVADPRPAL